MSGIDNLRGEVDQSHRTQTGLQFTDVFPSMISAHDVTLGRGQPAAEEFKKVGSGESGRSGANVEIPRLDALFVDHSKPVSHLREVSTGVERSSMPMVDRDGLNVIAKQLWPGETLASARALTAIIDLRNSRDIDNREALQTAMAPAIEYHNFSLDASKAIDGRRIDDIVATIDDARKAGKRVDIHCVNGTDRTGLISAAVKLHDDPLLREMMKVAPVAAYGELARDMIANGCEPHQNAQLFQDLKDYVNYKHDQVLGLPASSSVRPVREQTEKGTVSRADAAMLLLFKTRMLQDSQFSTAPLEVYRRELQMMTFHFDPASAQSAYQQFHDVFSAAYRRVKQ